MELLNKKEHDAKQLESELVFELLQFRSDVMARIAAALSKAPDFGVDNVNGGLRSTFEQVVYDSDYDVDLLMKIEARIKALGGQIPFDKKTINSRANFQKVRNQFRLMAAQGLVHMPTAGPLAEKSEIPVSDESGIKRLEELQGIYTKQRREFLRANSIFEEIKREILRLKVKCPGRDLSSQDSSELKKLKFREQQYSACLKAKAKLLRELTKEIIALDGSLPTDDAMVDEMMFLTAGIKIGDPILSQDEFDALMSAVPAGDGSSTANGDTPKVDKSFTSSVTGEWFPTTDLTQDELDAILGIDFNSLKSTEETIKEFQALYLEIKDALLRAESSLQESKEIILEIEAQGPEEELSSDDWYALQEHKAIVGQFDVMITALGRQSQRIAKEITRCGFDVPGESSTVDEENSDWTEEALDGKPASPELIFKVKLGGLQTAYLENKDKLLEAESSLQVSKKRVKELEAQGPDSELSPNAWHALQDHRSLVRQFSSIIFVFGRQLQIITGELVAIGGTIPGEISEEEEIPSDVWGDDWEPEDHGIESDRPFTRNRNPVAILDKLKELGHIKDPAPVDPDAVIKMNKGIANLAKSFGDTTAEEVEEARHESAMLTIQGSRKPRIITLRFCETCGERKRVDDYAPFCPDCMADLDREKEEDIPVYPSEDSPWVCTCGNELGMGWACSDPDCNDVPVRREIPELRERRIMVEKHICFALKHADDSNFNLALAEIARALALDIGNKVAFQVLQEILSELAQAPQEEETSLEDNVNDFLERVAAYGYALTKGEEPEKHFSLTLAQQSLSELSGMMEKSLLIQLVLEYMVDNQLPRGESFEMDFLLGKMMTYIAVEEFGSALTILKNFEELDPESNILPEIRQKIQDELQNDLSDGENEEFVSS